MTSLALMNLEGVYSLWLTNL